MNAALPRADTADQQEALAQRLRAAGDNAGAARAFARAIELAPERPQLRLLALLHEGTTQDAEGRVEEAQATFLRAVQEHPDSADAWAVLGTVQAHLAAPDVAEESLRRALQIDPHRPEVLERYARVLQDLRRHEDAALVFERLLKLEPDRPLTPGRLLHVKMLMADWTGYDRLRAHVEIGVARGLPTAEPFGLQGHCAAPEVLKAAAVQYAHRHHPPRPELLPQPPRGSAGPRVHVGYLAGEFRNQATAVLLTEVLERHDRSRFDITAFDVGWDDGSPLRRRIAACTPIVPLRGRSHLEVAQAVRAAGVDILVNLNGYFGLARTGVFSMRAAPVQVNYLGFPGTMGAPYMDYLLADRTVIPEADRGHYTEQVVYLPDSYQPNDAQRRVGDWPRQRADIGLPDDGFVFCCLNNVYKIVPEVYTVWMRVLQRVPDAVLLLYSADPVAQANLRDEAAARGVNPSRIRFGEPLANEHHLRRLQLCDLFLDTWPYNAHTTGSDALWSGLPLLTCTGRTFPSRVGASLLQAVGLPELVTADLTQYETRAVELAQDRPRLAALRERLAGLLKTAPLYDAPRYTRHLEAAYAQMAERARAGLPPQAFDVGP